ncbi:MAG: transporter substrate-binding domain-containing protein [Spirochaetes bacterium]|nr:transporter substrate-binding domain-containing protein [Spirochaetota bacterium]
MNKKIILSFVFLSILCSLNAKKPDILLLTTSEQAYDNDISAAVLRSAYQKIGIDIKIEYYPSLRSLDMSNSGKSDGEVHRVKGIETKYTNLICINSPVQYLDICVFSKNRNLKITSWDQVGNYKASYIRGIILSEQKLGKFNLQTENNQNDLIKQLENNRYDIIVTSRLSGIYSIKENGYKDIYMISTLDSVPLYHYLNKKHADIVDSRDKINRIPVNF